MVKLTTLLNENDHQLISETSLNRILGKHFDSGFIIISSYRGGNEKSYDKNISDFKELKQLIKNKGFSFIPVYGGYIENKGLPDEREIREPALLVTNYKIATSQAYADDKRLFDLGVELSNKYNQDSFLYKPKEKNEAYYIDKNGDINMTFKNKTVNDLTRIYFTDLVNIKNKSAKTSKRFTFTENIYINNSPKDVQEAISRYGEEFFNLN